jgi:hypothetical protein
LSRAKTEREKRRDVERRIVKAIALSCHPLFKQLLAEEYQQAYARALKRFERAEPSER